MTALNLDTARLEARLKLLIDKYCKKPIPMTTLEFLDSISISQEQLELDGVDIQELIEELEQNPEIDMMPITYNIFYKKIITETSENIKSKPEFYLTIYDSNLASQLQTIIEDPDLFEEPACISLDALYYAINDLRDNSQTQDKIYLSLLNLTEDLFGAKYKKIDNMLAQDNIDFESLWYYLDHRNKIYKVSLDNLECDIAFKYRVFSYIIKRDSESLTLIGDVHRPIGAHVSVCEFVYEIPKFNNTKKIDMLKVKELNTEDLETFANQGTSILELSKTIHHMKLDGKQYCHGPHDTILSVEKQEPIIVDFAGMIRYSNPVIDMPEQTIIDNANLNQLDYLTILPLVPIYNLGINKRWGLCHISKLTPINYHHDAFNYLVLDETKKLIIKCLINTKTTQDNYSDFIEGKGNGLIFLLYGSPGVGKTFTAEATCEFLQKPLYSVNVGDLGTDPEHMESILTIVLEYAKRWNAIVLIDEVDIFLEKRESQNIIRNAMVGIFLKVLEYQDGIIFLTTNRLDSLDPAVRSRINLMIRYEDLEDSRRRQVWASLFSKWNLQVTGEVLDKLAREKLNGREIRNIMRIVMALHKQRNLEISSKSILDVFKEVNELAQEFNKSIGPQTNMYL